MTTATATPSRKLPAYDGSSRALPWNVLGGDLTTSHPTVDAALEATGLDYDVQVLQSAAILPDGTVLDSGPQFRQIVRPDPAGGYMVIGQSGTRMTPIHNRDAFQVANELAAKHEATIKGACDYQHGRVSVMVVGLGVIDLNGGQDAVDLNLLIRNPHDGSGALSLSLTPFRPACTNAVHASISAAKRTWKISHTPNAQGRVDLATSALIAALNYRDAFQVKAEALIQQAVTAAEFAKIVAGLYPIAEGKEDTVAGQRRLETREKIAHLHRTSPTLEGVRDTAWGAYSAVTEYLDWYRPVRGEAAAARATAQLDEHNPYAKASARVWDRFAAMV